MYIYIFIWTDIEKYVSLVSRSASVGMWESKYAEEDAGRQEVACALLRDKRGDTEGDDVETCISLFTYAFLLLLSLLFPLPSLLLLLYPL